MGRLRAPFPYFGGKTKIADRVWRALGNDLEHYLEPFFGSGAVLFSCPNPPRIETVNDRDAFVCNCWRAIKGDPNTVAEGLNFPINHAELMARRIALNKEEPNLYEKIIGDPEYYNAKMAAYWIYAARYSIGGFRARDEGNKKIPTISHDTVGVAGIPAISDGNVGVAGMPMIGSNSVGVAGIPKIGAEYVFTGKSIIHELAKRLSRVRVVCGDWTRVTGGNWQLSSKPVGIFLDPPYEAQDRATVYTHDSTSIAKEVGAYALRMGKEEGCRVVLTGYEEHMWLTDHGWRTEAWKTAGGYGNQNQKGRAMKNAEREMIYYSPNCLIEEEKTPMAEEREEGQMFLVDCP
jgi:DNA adenine methylase